MKNIHLYLNGKLFLLVVLALALAFIANTMLYTYHAANPYARSDAWFQILGVLIPYFEQGFMLEHIFTGRGSGDHVQPLYKLLLIINAEFNSLNFRFESLIGMIALTAIFIILAFAAIKSSGKTNYNYLTLLILGLFCYSMNASVIYNWPLVTFWYVYLLLCVLLFVYIDGFLVTGGKEKSYLNIFLFSLIVFFLSGDVGKLSFIVISFLVVIKLVHTRDYKKYGLLLITLLMAQVLSSIPYNIYGSSESGSLLFLENALDFYYANFFEVWKLILYPSGHGIVMAAYFKKMLSGEWELYFIIFCILCFSIQLYAVYIFFRIGLHKKTYIPIFLILLSYLMVLGVAIYRIPNHSFEYLLQPRYVRTYLVGWIGVAWIFSYYLVFKLSKNDFHLRFFLPASFFLIACLLVQYLFSANSWGKLKYVNNFQDKRASEIIKLGENSSAIPELCRMQKNVLCKKYNDDNVKSIVSFLKHKELNMFSESVNSNYDKR